MRVLPLLLALTATACTTAPGTWGVNSTFPRIAQSLLEDRGYTGVRTALADRGCAPREQAVAYRSDQGAGVLCVSSRTNVRGMPEAVR